MVSCRPTNEKESFCLEIVLKRDVVTMFSLINVGTLQSKRTFLMKGQFVTSFSFPIIFLSACPLAFYAHTDVALRLTIEGNLFVVRAVKSLWSIMRFFFRPPPQPHHSPSSSSPSPKCFFKTDPEMLTTRTLRHLNRMSNH